MSTPVPGTALSRYTQTFSLSALVINSKGIGSQIQNADDQLYWYVVVSLTDLSVVANVTSSSNDSVPSEVQQYAGNDEYFLFFIANAQSSRNVPQSALTSFLKNSGAGSGLENMEQLIGQIGTGSLRYFSYILAGTLGSNDLPGFERFSTQDYVTMAMQFVPYTVEGKTMYAPTIRATP